MHGSLYECNVLSVSLGLRTLTRGPTLDVMWTDEMEEAGTVMALTMSPISSTLASVCYQFTTMKAYW